MKRILLLGACVTCCCLKSLAQEGVFTGKFENAPLTDLFKSIEGATPYRFYYVRGWIDTVSVTANFESTPLSEVLERSLGNNSLQFYADGNNIILTLNVPILPGTDASLFDNSQVSLTQTNYNFLREYKTPAPGKRTGTQKPVLEIGVKHARVSTGNVTLVGYVREKVSGEPISGASIYTQNPLRGTTTNAYGFYSLSVPAGPNTVITQYVGMKQVNQNIMVHSDGKMNIQLEDDVISLKEVTIESDRDANFATVQTGITSVDMKSVKNIPKVLGENDILKVAVTLPGVKTVGEGAAGLNVRGGSADQNLMLINEATVYNSSHFLGFFSVFNADAIKTTELYKSGIPAHFGGRLSSIFDIQMKDGNQKKFSGQGGIGSVMARLTLEIPVIRDRTSIIVGGRTTYSDWVLHQIPRSTLKNSSASFYDLVTRVSHRINDKNSVYLSLYFSRDKFKLSTDSLFSYSNALGSLQLRHIFNNSMSGVLSLTHSNYSYSIDYQPIPETAFNFGFNIKESNLKWDMTQYHGKHKLDYGFQSKYYFVEPGTLKKAAETSIVDPITVNREQGIENALYFADNFEINPQWSFYVGLRYSAFTSLGPATVYHYRADVSRDLGTITDTVKYRSGPIHTYGGPEYRVSTRYTLARESSLKFSYNRTRQYIHMLSNTVSVSPTNTWKLSDPNVMPQLADQIALGYYKNLRNNTLELSAEAYYKWLQHVIDYKTGSELLLNRNIEKDILQGNGKAYGIEFMIRKRTGKINGWISYTYSRTFLKMDSRFSQENVNRGAYYPANFDKPHDLSIVSNYKITRRYSFSANFVYSTGRPVTYPTGQYWFGGAYKINYSERNQFRIPDNIRLDLGFNIEGNHKVNQISHNNWNISIYNLLGRRNPYSVYFVAKDGTLRAYKLSVFGAAIPTITYNFKF